MISSSYTKCSDMKNIDCRSWYDFGQQILYMILTIILLLRVIKHYRNLKKQKQDQVINQHQKSIRRKIKVNLILICYLFSLLINTIYDLYLFYAYQQYYKNPNAYNMDVLTNVYKVCQVIYIHFLNSLNITVGLLYWKATRAYYVLSDLKQPFLFRRMFKALFVGLFAFIILIVIVTIILKIGLNKTDDPLWFKIITLASTTICILTCIICRILYRRFILTKIDLSPKAIKKQKIMSFLLCTSSLFRIIYYFVDITYEQWVVDIRNQQIDPATGICLDVYPFYAIVLLVINLIINLLPAAIYGHLFVSQVSTKTKAPKNLKLLQSQTQYQ